MKRQRVPPQHPLLFRTANPQHRHLSRPLHNSILDFLPSSDLLSLFHVSYVASHLIRQHLGTRKMVALPHPAKPSDSVHMLGLALKYCRRLSHIRVWNWEFDDLRHEAAEFARLARLVNLNAATLQVFERGCQDPLDAKLMRLPCRSGMFPALGRCASLRSVQLGCLYMSNEVEAAYQILALPSLRELSFSPDSPLLDFVSKSLTHLTIPHQIHPADAVALPFFRSLTSLVVSFDLFSISDFRPLQSLTSLTHLDLSICGHPLCNPSRPLSAALGLDDLFSTRAKAMWRFMRSRATASLPSANHFRVPLPASFAEQKGNKFAYEVLVVDLPLLKTLKMNARAVERVSVQSKRLEDLYISENESVIAFEEVTQLFMPLVMEMLRASPVVHKVEVEGIPDLEFLFLPEQTAEFCLDVLARLSQLKVWRVLPFTSFVLGYLSQCLPAVQELSLCGEQFESLNELLSVMRLPHLKRLEIVDNFPPRFYGTVASSASQHKRSNNFATNFPIICPSLLYLTLPHCPQYFLDCIRCPSLLELSIGNVVFLGSNRVLYLDSLLASASSLVKLELDVPGRFRKDVDVEDYASSSSSSSSSTSSSSSSSAFSLSRHPWSLFTRLSRINITDPRISKTFAKDVLAYLPNLRELALSLDQPEDLIKLLGSTVKKAKVVSSTLRTLDLAGFGNDDEMMSWICEMGSLDEVLPVVWPTLRLRLPALRVLKYPEHALCDSTWEEMDLPCDPQGQIILD